MPPLLRAQGGGPTTNLPDPVWSKRLCQHFLSDAAYFICRVVTFFNEIIKAAYLRSKAAYKLKIIARTSSIINHLLGLIYAPVATLWLGLALGLALGIALSKFV